jgi:hypothetical protein
MRKIDPRFENPDENVRLGVLADLAVDRGVKIDIVNSLTLSGISSLTFIEFLRTNPDFCDAIDARILESPECPDIVKVICIPHSSSEENLARLLSSPATSEIVYSEFNPEVRDALREKKIRALEIKIRYEAGRKSLNRYIKKKAPFFLPVFVEQNPNSLDHRTASLIGGIPFTSKDFDWPRCPAGKLMQPIVQIDLRDAGQRLKRNFDRGLLQVWARQVDGGWSWDTAWPRNSHRENFDVRFISESALTMSSALPAHEDMPWMVSIEDFKQYGGPDINNHSCLMIHSKVRLDKPRIQSWRCFGSMFPHRNDHSASILNDYGFFESCIERLPHPDSLSIPNSCYLGGFGGGNCNGSPPYPLTMSDGRRARLLFNYQSAGDCYEAVNFSLFFAETKRGFEYEFHHYWSY